MIRIAMITLALLVSGCGDLAIVTVGTMREVMNEQHARLAASMGGEVLFTYSGSSDPRMPQVIDAIESIDSRGKGTLYGVGGAGAIGASAYGATRLFGKKD